MLRNLGTSRRRARYGARAPGRAPAEFGLALCVHVVLGFAGAAELGDGQVATHVGPRHVRTAEGVERMRLSAGQRAAALPGNRRGWSTYGAERTQPVATGRTCAPPESVRGLSEVPAHHLPSSSVVVTVTYEARRPPSVHAPTHRPRARTRIGQPLWAYRVPSTSVVPELARCTRSGQIRMNVSVEDQCDVRSDPTIA